MWEEIKKINTSKKALRQFGWTLCIGLAIVGGIWYWRTGNLLPWFFYIAGVFGVLGTLVPAVLKPLQIPWMLLAVLLGAVMSRVVLTILFFLVVTPLALVAKLFRKKFLQLSWDSAASSYWIQHEGEPESKDRYEKQY